MEFSYRVTDREIGEAFWLNFWSPRRTIFVATVALAALLDLLLFFEGIRSALLNGGGISEVLNAGASNSQTIFLVVLVAVLSVYLVVLPRRAVRIFRRFPFSGGDILATVTTEHLEIRLGTAGSSCFNWSIYQFWREGKSVVMIKLRSGQYQFLPKAGLSDSQLEELRGILSAALPQK